MSRAVRNQPLLSREPARFPWWLTTGGSGGALMLIATVYLLVLPLVEPLAFLVYG